MLRCRGLDRPAGFRRNDGASAPRRRWTWPELDFRVAGSPTTDPNPTVSTRRSPRVLARRSIMECEACPSRILALDDVMPTEDSIAGPGLCDQSTTGNLLALQLRFGRTRKRTGRARVARSRSGPGPNRRDLHLIRGIDPPFP
jgi:hypothetical protein